MYRLPQFIAALLTGLLANSAAMAHVGIHSAGGFTAGFAHPFIGLDHLLAMVAVGVWAVQLGGRSLLVLPATFVSFMAAGAALGVSGVPLPQVDGIIALSVLALGIAVGLSGKKGSDPILKKGSDPIFVATVGRGRKWGLTPFFLVAAFAVFHGHAHGAEVPGFGAPWLYFTGFLVATAVLHAGGIAAGVLLKARPGVLRLGGAAIGLAGAWLVVSL